MPKGAKKMLSEENPLQKFKTNSEGVFPVLKRTVFPGLRPRERTDVKLKYK